MHNNTKGIRKIQKFEETHKLLALGQSTNIAKQYPIIDKNFLCYNLVDHYFSSFLLKEIVENVVKGFIF
jgi:hypothetical protein